MAMTLAQLRSHATHAVNAVDAALPPGTTAEAAANQIVNQAGRALYSSHKWKFRETVSADLDFTADQSFVAMPASFGQLVGYQVNGLTNSFELTTLQLILDYRAKSIQPVGFHWWGAFVHPRRENATTPPTPARLELFPTPTETIEDALTVYFRASWTELTDDTHVPDIPLYCETLLIAFIRAFAKGYMLEHGEDGAFPTVTLDARIAEVKAGPIFMDAVNEDGGVQPDYGVVGPGLIDQMTTSIPSVVRPDNYDPWPQGDPYIT